MNWLLFYFISGLVLGGILGLFLTSVYIGKTYYAGTLKKMDSDEGDPYLYLDLDKHPNAIGDYKYVLFIVDFHKQRSQK